MQQNAKGGRQQFSLLPGPGRADVCMVSAASEATLLVAGRARMPRRRQVATPPPVASQLNIQDSDVFTKETLHTRLGLTGSCLRREIRLGRLRVAKRAGRYFFLGAWVLDWLRAGECRRPENGVVPEKAP